MTNQIQQTDQWQLNGDCEKCRRGKYCTKPCSAKKRRDKRALHALTNAIIDAVAPSQSLAENTKKYY